MNCFDLRLAKTMQGFAAKQNKETPVLLQTKNPSRPAVCQSFLCCYHMFKYLIKMASNFGVLF